MAIKLTDLDPALLSYVLRMAIPFKREFGNTLNPQEFFDNEKYAEDILELASTSQDPRLQTCVSYLLTNFYGPRRSGGGSKAAATVAAASATSAVSPVAAVGSVADQPMTEAERKAKQEHDEARDEAIARYRSRLR